MQLSERQLDIVKKLIAIGIGRAASMLNEMLDPEIKLSISKTILTDCSTACKSIFDTTDEKISSVEYEFSGNISGILKLLLKKDDALELVSHLTGEAKGTYELDAVSVGTLTEVGNIILNSILSSFVTLRSSQFNFSLPNFNENYIENIVCTKHNLDINNILIHYIQFNIEDLKIGGAIVSLVDKESLEKLKEIINGF